MALSLIIRGFWNLRGNFAAAIAENSAQVDDEAPA